MCLKNLLDNCLRDQLKDPLFVRTAKGIAPTEFGRQIEHEVREIARRAQALAARKPSFNPLQAEGRIVLATTDYFEAVVMPRLIPILEQEAPNIQISLRPTLGELPKRDLEEGKVDLAIAGFYRDLPEGFYQTRLFTDSFSCATRKGHSLIKNSLDKRQYHQSRHALITLQGDLRDPAGRKITYGSYSFTGMAWVLQHTDLILTAPTRLLKCYEEHFPLRIWPCPVDRKSIELRMVWHEQTHRNPLRAWFRKKLAIVSSNELA